MSIKNLISVEEIPNKPKRGDCFSIGGAGATAYTHGIFKYPCKFIPHIPRWFLSAYGSKKTLEFGVLDPFMGSGTSLVESNLLGYPAYGLDVDPLSKLLSKVKTTPFSKKELVQLGNVIEELKANLEKKKVSTKHLENFRPNFKNLTYWFSGDAIERLLKISFFIVKYEEDTDSEKIGDLMRITLASVVRKASLADEQSPKPYISTRIAKKTTDIFDLYLANLEKNFKAISQFSAHRNLGKTKIIGIDARKVNLKQLKGNKVHLAVTSPPYINAFDYVRSLKLENFWLRYISDQNISELYDLQVGTEKLSIRNTQINSFKIEQLDGALAMIKETDPKRAVIVSEYFKAMDQNIETVHESLIAGGYYCIVVGDSVIRNINVATSRILIEIAKSKNFRLIDDFSYVIRNRYLRIPRAGKGGFIPVDHVLVFQKK